MPATHINDQDFKEKVIDSDIPVMVDFYAEWCGPCKMAAPIIDELADTYNGKATIVKVNVDENNKTAGEYGVMSIPTVVMFKDGKEIDRKIGFAGKEGYEGLIKSAIGA